MEWGDCELIYNKENKKISSQYQTGLLRYFHFFPDATEENIWLDKDQPGAPPGHDPKSSSIWYYAHSQYFSSAQTLSNPHSGQNHHFISRRGDFVNGQYPDSSAWMQDRYTTLRKNFSERPEMLNTEVRCGYCKEIETLRKQESVMILGGGPSSLLVDYSQFGDVPKWTMNSFYTNEKMTSLTNIQLVTFLDSVDLKDPKLWESLNKFKPLVIQEITDLGTKRIMEIKSNYDKMTYMHTRYRSRIGVGARLIIFAILLGFKKIYITGMDGYDLNSSKTHAFEKGKRPPDWLYRMGPNIQKQNFVIFWDYVQNTLKKSYDFEIIDLSKGADTVQYKFIQEKI
tara:strand:+ start:1696 stop:2718 length:1023 start_codon:yes stop_codon:yes gene_type:complete